ncbi:uncharacterized protein LOC115667180 [Syzygium oleosum]|uniref:uncharacterized protein LOC115667180 n=1 Tax=Syzygium oleosum TaxID=219896 RepID=UPI0024B8EF9D|nr:uncharacterized protein LOC115667180 [Syzygium oleosum]
MAVCLCSAKLIAAFFLLSAIPFAYLISLELSPPTTHVLHYHSSGFLRECAKWDAPGRRFLVSFLEGGVGQVLVPDDRSPAVLEEATVVKDADLAGNASLGLAVDGARGRLLVAVADVIGNRYSAVAAYDLSTWKRAFLTQLSGPSKRERERERERLLSELNHFFDADIDISFFFFFFAVAWYVVCIYYIGLIDIIISKKSTHRFIFPCYGKR